MAGTHAVSHARMHRNARGLCTRTRTCRPTHAHVCAAFSRHLCGVGPQPHRLRARHPQSPRLRRQVMGVEILVARVKVMAIIMFALDARHGLNNVLSLGVRLPSAAVTRTTFAISCMPPPTLACLPQHVARVVVGGRTGVGGVRGQHRRHGRPPGPQPGPPRGSTGTKIQYREPMEAAGCLHGAQGC